MIRPITQADAAAVGQLAVAAGLFPADEIAFLDTMMANYFGGNQAEGHRCIVEVEGDLLGVAYYQPALATDRTWYVTMIGVRHEYQRQGHGAALLRYVEQQLRADGQRVLLVETSSVPDFAYARQFYAKNGYEEEAHIRDYYAAGDDMVVFRKVLNLV